MNSDGSSSSMGDDDNTVIVNYDRYCDDYDDCGDSDGSDNTGVIMVPV
ncbi:Uncharacterized protein BM_BM17683 [Brugia malayi]|uniref:Uncharacterized protein n=1 Tax=Brugia malayi TaxID=6279 RepID=A0A4E9FJT9_BRUMA|nr:Uncharacterized protein BM_BM17683 [Brugia malayi]VIO97215.1 Uncharacterized protein BM_BM17683 [Brugia malayi]